MDSATKATAPMTRAVVLLLRVSDMHAPQPVPEVVRLTMDDPLWTTASYRNSGAFKPLCDERAHISSIPCEAPIDRAQLRPTQQADRPPK
jgi:hypothetical protein